MHDVVDYWNLRAAGFRIFSLPVDCYKDYAERAKAFARWSMDPSVPKPFAGPKIVKARSVEDDVSDTSSTVVGRFRLKASSVSHGVGAALWRKTQQS